MILPRSFHGRQYTPLELPGPERSETVLLCAFTVVFNPESGGILFLRLPWSRAKYSPIRTISLPRVSTALDLPLFISEFRSNPNKDSGNAEQAGIDPAEVGQGGRSCVFAYL